MAGQARKLTVALSPNALAALDEIWDWNAKQYGAEHANRYVSHLLAETSKLASKYFRGKPVPVVPRLSYLIIRRRRKSHAHLAVYELINDVIHVLNFYDTAQDWQTELANQFR